MKVNKISFRHLKKLNRNGETYKDYSLKNCNTFKVGGKCDYFLKICTLENFIQVMQYLNSKSIRPFVLGNGSNLLISDTGYRGVIITFAGDFKRIETNETMIECGAGVSLGLAYATAKNLSLKGLECSAGIPASIGGATLMNAGANEFEMSKLVDYVVAYVDGKIDYFRNAECGFSYRNSVFKENNAIILRVAMQLQKGDKTEIENMYINTLNKRKEKQPLEYGSAGCVFKNQDNILVGKMLDEDGYKGKMIGGAMVSHKHANFIINHSNATASDIYKLIKTIQEEFYQKHKINLECEIKFLGEFDETKR